MSFDAFIVSWQRNSDIKQKGALAALVHLDANMLISKLESERLFY